MNSIKQNIKDKAMERLRAVPSYTLSIANAIVKKGIPNVLNYNYKLNKGETLSFVNSLKVAPFTYKYAHSSKCSTLYASAYACMLYSLYGELDNFDNTTKKEWAEYFNQFQGKDGYFRDPALIGEEFDGDVHWGDGWGIRHLAGHLIICFARLGHKPRYPFLFLEPYYNLSYLESWLNGLFEKKDMWSASNYIMNIVTLFQYSRDYMNDMHAQKAIKYILCWLEAKQDKQSGLWLNKSLVSKQEILTAIRGAYHYFPLFIYENRPVNYQEKIVDYILQSQNTWGGFAAELSPSGACEDIDALDPLMRFTINTEYRKPEVEYAVKKALYWVMANKNTDGGFTFMPETPHEYGSHPQTSSKSGESNLFATWFRTLCLSYMVKYLNIENDFDIRKYPGYEISMCVYA